MPRCHFRGGCRLLAALLMGVTLVAITPNALLGSTPPSPAGPTWPLRVRPGSRFVEDAAGTPFRVNADAAWFAPTEFWLADAASAADFETYLADREARGFTAILVMGMVQSGYNDFSGYPRGAYTHLPNNRISSEPPLTTPDDFSTLDAAYWDNVEAIVAAARAHGMAVLLAYNYLGYGGYGDQGWWKAIQEPQNTQAVMRAFGHSLAQRFAHESNVIWYPFGDFNPPPGEGLDRVRASIEGIQEVLPDAVFAAELDSPSDLVTDNAVADELLNADSFYGYGPDGHPGEVYLTAARAWASTPVRPAWVAEPQYEGAGIGGSGDRTDVRLAEYYSVLGGGTAGQTYGAISVYNFAPPSDGPAFAWRHALELPGAADMAVQFRLWSSMPWWLLVPSGTQGTFYGLDIVTDGQADGLQHIVAAGTTDDTTVVAYVPPGQWHRTFTIDLSRLPATASAVWLDPTTGAESAIPGVTGGGSRSVTTPGFNAAGVGDWVLVARA